MNEDHDPALQALFDRANVQIVGDDFVAMVTKRMSAQRRRLLIGRLAVAALLVLLELLLDSPLQNSLGTMTDVLGASLFPIRHEWLAFVAAPVNTVAGLIGLLLLALHFFYRRIAY